MRRFLVRVVFGMSSPEIEIQIFTGTPAVLLYDSTAFFFLALSGLNDPIHFDALEQEELHAPSVGYFPLVDQSVQG